jgi:drug/metabolite transporter (DMT)-like permease
MAQASRHARGRRYAAATAILMGTTPILGKLTIEGGTPPFSVVALRTFGAALMIFLVVLVFRRRLLYIYPVGMIGCLLAGALNGAGSLLFYASLARIDASLVQLFFSLYPVHVAVLLYLDGQRPSPLTLLRLALAVPAVYLLAAPQAAAVDLTGVLLALGAGLLFALHIPVNERVLYEVPAPTVTLYTLLAMTAVVVPAGLLLPGPMLDVPPPSLAPLAGLTVVTFLSRLALFAGVKQIGGLQTSLLGLAEMLVALGLANVWLGERLTATQWVGVLLLIASLLLIGLDPSKPTVTVRAGWLHWLRPPLPPASPEVGDRTAVPAAGGAQTRQDALDAAVRQDP